MIATIYQLKGGLVSHSYSLIPARGGSKGLPKKNLCSLLGKPLIEHTINASLSSGVIDETFVSSDCKDILEVSKNIGSSVILRPENLAGDTTPTDPVIEHFIQEKGLKSSDIICLLQPTSPLRDQTHVKQAFEQFKKDTPKALFSMFQARHTPYKAFELDDSGLAKGHFSLGSPFQRRQDFPDLYFANGAIYIFTVDSFMEKQCIPRDLIQPYIMNEIDSIDIDDQNDLSLVEIYLKVKNEQ